MIEEIERARKEIDKIDRIIIEALVKRINYVLEIIKYKNNEDEVRGCDRVKIVLDNVRNIAANSGGHEDVIVEIYKCIIGVLTSMQMQILANREAL